MNAIVVDTIVNISNPIDTYDLYTIAYIPQHNADIIPIKRIRFLLLVKNDYIDITDAIIGNIEYIF